MTKELCGHPTANGPCNMKKGHAAPFHRYREYPETKWVMKNANGQQLAHGAGINPMTTAIAKNRRDGIKLLIEISC